MGTKYLLTCDCGQERIVETKQAGETVRCTCGLSLDVPTLRQLRQLPRAEPSDDSSRRPVKPWSQGQGWTFAAGLVVTAVAAGTIAILLPRRLKLDTSPPPLISITQEQLDAVTPAESWTAWQSYLDFQLDRTQVPAFIANRRRASALNWQLVAAAFGLAIGTATALLAYVYTPASARHKTRQ